MSNTKTIYDFIHAGDELDRARQELTDALPGVEIEDASDGVLSVLCDVPVTQYAAAMFSTGMVGISEYMNNMRASEPIEFRLLLLAWKKENGIAE